ncbi:MAG: cupredoxin domain-containing protein [Herpetosiphonaceae bacterium]|nr:cupredoxin domain-containing protein [Herpetosiphonaceae bacterium]
MSSTLRRLAPLFLLLGLASCTQPAPAATYTIEMYDNYFRPVELHFPTADVVRLKVVNHGKLIHNFEVDIRGHKGIVAGPGGDNVTTLLTPPPGRYPFACSVPGHQGMQGVIVIDP